MKHHKHFLSAMAGLAIFTLLIVLAGCSQTGTSGSADYSQDLKKIADGLGVSNRTSSTTTSKATTSPSSVGTLAVRPTSHETADGQGGFTSTATFIWAGEPHTQNLTAKYYDANDDPITDTNVLHSKNTGVNKMVATTSDASPSMNVSASFTIRGLREVLELLANYFFTPAQSAQNVTLNMTGSATINYSSGFVLTISSIVMDATYQIPAGGTVANISATSNISVSWSAENGLYTGTITGTNVTETSSLSGKVFRQGTEIGTITMSSQGEVTITDTEGRVIKSTAST